MPSCTLPNLEVDRRAVEPTAKAGFDPAALLAYVDGTEPTGMDVRRSFSTLPDRAVRLGKLREAVTEVEGLLYSSPTGRFEDVQQKVPGLMAGPKLPIPSLRNPRR